VLEAQRSHENIMAKIIYHEFTKVLTKDIAPNQPSKLSATEATYYTSTEGLK
jgi:hypothetical protein